jgi:hypothetical protein
MIKWIKQLLGIYTPNILLVKGEEESYEQDLAFPTESAQTMAKLRKNQVPTYLQSRIQQIDDGIEQIRLNIKNEEVRLNELISLRDWLLKES